MTITLVTIARWIQQHRRGRIRVSIVMPECCYRASRALMNNAAS
jgi:hypothetical protein